MEKEKKILKFQNLIIYYFACSFIGWIMEMIYGYMVLGKFVDRGFLYGPICPIYGYGAVLMVLIAEWMQNKKHINIFIKIVIITILFTLLEYTGSVMLEAMFGLRWWDYTNEFFNINGRVCLIFSVMFGVMGTAFVELVYEPSKRLIEKLNTKVENKVIWIALIFLIVIWVADTFVSTLRYML